MSVVGEGVKDKRHVSLRLLTRSNTLVRFPIHYVPTSQRALTHIHSPTTQDIVFGVVLKDAEVSLARAYRMHARISYRMHALGSLLHVEHCLGLPPTNHLMLSMYL